MVKFLSTLLEFLEKSYRPPAADAVETAEKSVDPDFSTAPVPEALRNQAPSAKPPAAEAEEVNIFQIGQDIKTYGLNRWEAVRRHRWFALGIFVFLLLLYFLEDITRSWVGDLLRNISRWLNQQWLTRPIAIIFIVLALLLLFFGLKGFLNIFAWVIRKWSLVLILLIVLLIVVIYISPVTNSWVFRPAETSLAEIDGERIATQFRGSLNSIGVAPFETISLTEPNRRQLVDDFLPTKQEITLAICDDLLRRPPKFTEPSPDLYGGGSAVIEFVEKDAKVQLNPNQQLSVSTVVGSFNLPLENLFRFTLLTFAPNYREFRTQIIPVADAGRIQIVVNDDEGTSWTVRGPRAEIPQLINFLAHRIVIDDRETLAVDDKVLAMALGNRAFRARNYVSALAYYRLAEWFQREDPNQEFVSNLFMYSLTHLQLSRLPTAEAAAHLAQAQALMERAIAAEANTLAAEGVKASSSVVGIYPYMACIYDKVNETDKSLAQSRLEVFVSHIQNLRELDPESEVTTQARINALTETPPLGPGRYLSLFAGESTFDLYYLGDNQIHYLLEASLAGPNLENVLTELLPAEDVKGNGEAPKQIFAVGQGAYYLTSDGLVKFFQPQAEQKFGEVYGLEALRRLNSPSRGVRQILAHDTATEGHLFLIDPLGRVVRLPAGHPPQPSADPLLAATSIISDARQIYLDGNNLALLTTDGTVWRIDDPFGGNLQAAQQVVSDPSNRQIVMAGGIIYMLRDNGNIWRYSLAEDEPEPHLQIVAGGPSELVVDISIVPGQGLVLLKADGRVTLLRNPQNPSQEDKVELLPAGDAARLTARLVGTTLLTLEQTEQGPAQLLAATVRQSSEPTPTATPAHTATPQPTPCTPRAQEWVPATADPGLSLAALAEQTGRTVEILQAGNCLESATLVEGQALLLPPTLTPTATPTLTPTPMMTPTATASATPIPPTSVPPTDTPTPLAELNIRSLDGAPEVLIQGADGTNLFWIDQLEVTNARYQQCLAAENGCSTPEDFAETLDPNLPVVNVTWAEAGQYCAWAGAELPTLAQWTQAVQVDYTPYLLGNPTPSCEMAVLADCGSSGPFSVGSKAIDPANPLELKDMLGNVWEWTNTSGDSDGNTYRVVGGAWDEPKTPGDNAVFLPENGPAFGVQADVLPPHSEINLGFRCARPFIN